MARNKSSRTDEWKPKPSRIRIAAMRIIWGDTPIVPATRGSAGREACDIDVWLVPSEKSGHRYTVNLLRKTCSCPGWRSRRVWDKHLEAARIWKAAAQLGNDAREGTAALQAVPNPYKQEPWYDALCAREEVIVRELARCLGQHFGIVRSENRKSNAGRYGYALGDFLACGIVAGYLNRPSRKAIPFHAAEAGLVRGDEAPYHSTLRTAMKRPAMRKAVKKVREMIARCTSKIDTVFSIDATVMKTPLSQVHFQRQAQGLKVVTKILNCKVHLAIGIETFIVYGVHVTDGDVHDTNGFMPCMEEFEDFVRLDAVLADAGYCKADFYEYVGNRGGRAIIDMSDIEGRGHQDGKPYYNAAFDQWDRDAEEWLDAYGYRWLSESANSSLKRTIKRVIRAKYEETREVEVGLAVIAFQLKWLAHARAKFGPDRVPIPWADAKALALIDEVTERCRGRRKPKPEEEAA